MLAWSLPRQQVFAPCEYTRYWRRRENLLAQQCATLPWAIIPQQYEKCGLERPGYVFIHKSALGPHGAPGNLVDAIVRAAKIARDG